MNSVEFLSFSARAVVRVLAVLGVLYVTPGLAGERLPVKVVVLSMFENGEPTGDKPGELQLWLERNPGLREMPFALGEYSLYYDDKGLLVACLGGGIPNATASTMALGLDERFDLTKAYWLIAGIAGGDPEDLSLGSAAWANAVVDGDLVYEIDAREIPEDWPYGFIPLGASKPADGPQDVSTGWTLDTISFALDSGLSEWAYQLTRNTPLMDTEAMQAFRKEFTNYPLAQRPPFVTRGDTLSASTYWHGEKLNEWANDWLKVYAGESAEFMTSNMEDSGTLTALHRLGRIDRVDPRRVLILRTASNYTMPPRGRSAAWSTTADYPDGGLGALETAQRVGQPVVDALLGGWDVYEDQLPSAPARIPVVFDTDMAIDDWAALLFLARHPGVELLAVTVAASGEAHCEPGTRNALALLDLVNPHNAIPVSCGDAYPLDGYFVFPVPWQKDMDTLSGVPITPSLREPDGRHAVELLHDVHAAADKPVTVLATGPLTNIAQWLERYPEDPAKTERLVIMGGALDAPGNIIVPGFTDDNPNTRAEWNIYVDALAADKVLRSDLAMELVGLDVTNHVKVTPAFAAAFKTRVDNPAAAFWDAVLDANTWFIDSGEYYFWDVLAALAVIDRERFCDGEMLALGATYEETEEPWWATSDKSMPDSNWQGAPRRHFAAETAGVIERREGAKNTLFCRDTDPEAAFRLFIDTLTARPLSSGDK
ncbi:nucleoside hydrolase [Congregibacter litoralis]|uniref:Purine nucleoside permease n=1 Tax=Congregibacter litoralis KT71 TaxID=314285 RepID=A4ADQ7_9GAMM|nr:nucleoside hydrolase [Congregibacter litoralis]EAQ95865.2 Purine nucleoside permease [Congregibacter litoralis KT71]